MLARCCARWTGALRVDRQGDAKKFTVKNTSMTAVRLHAERRHSTTGSGTEFVAVSVARSEWNGERDSR